MKSLFKKSNGSSGVFDMFPMILMILVLSCLFVNFAGYIKYFDVLNEVENLAGRYMLIMESTGGLTEEDKITFCQKLEDLGINDEMIDLTGTTYSNANICYGDEIFLKMRIVVPYRTSSMEVEIVKCAIALV